MKRILAALGVTGLALLGATAPATAGDNESGDHKITICHATGSDSNPYVSVTVDQHALKAHGDHWKDIIPAGGWAVPDGQNLDKLDIWKAGCTVPADDGNGDDHGDDDGHKVTICHATGSDSYVQITVGYKALKGHAQHGDDIIPPTGKWEGQNWDDEGQATYNNDCVPCPPEVVTPETPPVVTPPVETPPVVTPPVETPTGAVVVPPVVVPPVVTPPVAAAVVVANNAGFNVQTAVAPTDTGLAPWAAGLIVMMLAAAGVAARKGLQEGGHAGNRKH